MRKKNVTRNHYYALKRLIAIVLLLTSIYIPGGYAEMTLSQDEIMVSGVVKSGSGMALPGVSVRLKSNSSKLTITNNIGAFSIQAQSTDSLVFSYVGFVSKTVAINGIKVHNVQLESEGNQMEEVVVVGYGTQKKVNLTGAISNIDGKAIQTTTHTSLAQKLQGKIAGLQIRQNTGGPGDFDAMINIRGFGSPLYVIDGIARDGGSEFQRINPEDIESISVLKDASAAIYGLNAANGVIIVTTKKGKKGKPQFKYNAVVGVQSPTGMPEMATAAQWMEMRNEADINIGKSPYISKEELLKYQQGIPGYESINWYDETMKKYAGQQQHTISAQGGSDAINYFTSFGYQTDNGLLKSNALNYEKYTFRTNLTANLAKDLTAEIQLSGRYDKKNAPGESFFEILRGTVSSLPNHRPYANDNPEYPALVTDGQSKNPLALSDRNRTGYAEDVNKFFQSSVALTYNMPFLEGLRVKGLASFDGNNYLGKNLAKSYQLFNYDAATDKYIATDLRNPTSIHNGYIDNNRVSLQAHLLYDKVIATDHKLGITLVYEQRSGWDRNASLRREYQFYTNDQIDMAGLNNQQTSGIEHQFGSKSFIGRTTYNYKEKYLFELAARYDGSYRYHPDRRWGLFPVASVGWRISEESFIKEKAPFIYNLKLRASYGLVGQDAGNPFQYVAGFSTTGGGGYEFNDGSYSSGASAPGIVNENLTWFKSNIKNVGLDLGFFEGKLSMEIDAYQRDRTGLLAYRNVSLPNTFGGSLPQENLNSDRVRGLEFTINHRQTLGDFSYSLSGNFNFARTMNVYVERGPFLNSMDKWRNGSANRWNDIVWMYDVEGQFQSQDELVSSPIQNGDLGNSRELVGDFKYRDANGDGLIDGNDALPSAWGGNPKMHYGLTLNASWKGFDLNALFQGSGNYSVRFTHAYATMFWGQGNEPAYFYDRWHKADAYNPDSEWIPGKWPAARLEQDIGALYSESSVWRKDASYVRLKSLELGYSFSGKLMQSLKISGLRIYLNAYNLFTITDPFVRPFDPEQIEGAYNAGWVYPVSKSYNIGVNVNF
ncbi:TonB-dependent receptor [Pedobacter sp. B4-66]|uniref:SusC/RagA family TonB-linked outer membrane protein n=1 Tax=Pedobacter sp. B4-66 TaxID=2817280 RepID=UPI001BDA15DD|nr:TonB-dependent receptor [Pedobacter sp. B4-66]